ncbi:NACHT domain-containing protein [Polyangium aurulentum]|uniref:NACHT domain-containing protein n=1 Tax=Polyangium aurulentum TaxID=2567896 RepID=UPI00146C9AE8|nr:TIR domain-containing protein [Polyangium aurulentum]UQA61779.1 TIR domain-containing protein [Polyangium aurulentum]
MSKHEPTHAMAKAIQRALRIFVSYAQQENEDGGMVEELDRHLKPLVRLGTIELAYAWRLLPGTEIVPEIERQIDLADVVLLLVSAKYLESDDCFGQMTRAVARHKAGAARVMPILVGPCCWEDQPFAAIEILPQNKRPIRRWADPDEGWDMVARELRAIIATRPGQGSGRAPAWDDTQWQQHARALAQASRPLRMWPQYLPGNVWLERPELDSIVAGLQKEQAKPIVLLGGPGSGKSALLARVTETLQGCGRMVLAIRADQLLRHDDSIAALQRRLALPTLPADMLRAAAARPEHAVLIIDQLDALCDLVDMHTQRLDLLLHLVAEVEGTPGLGIVLSCREFEFRHDTRFLRLDAEEIHLAPPAPEVVEQILRERGIDPKALRGPFAEGLRAPQQLKIFLNLIEGREPAPIFDSYQQMLETLWQERVIGQQGSEAREQLLVEVAAHMAREEELSAPLARFEHRSREVDQLEAAGILRREESRRVAFTHQTWFTFVRARAFITGKERLSEYVREHGSSLFVRATLWAALVTLREAEPRRYHDELLKLWSAAGLRTHLRALLVEFLGQQEKPTDDEAQILLPLLQQDDYLRRVALGALAGSCGWFERIVNSHLPVLMSGPDPGAVWGPLAGASSFARERVLDLLERYWVHVAERRPLALGVLRSLEVWDERAVKLVIALIEGDEAGTLPRIQISLIVANVAKQAPDLACRIVRLILEQDLRRCPIPAEGQQQGWFHHPYQNLLERDHGLDLIELASQDAKAFLEAVWPWAVRVVDKIAAPAQPALCSYRRGGELERLRQEGIGPVHEIPEALGRTIEESARKDPDYFTAFVERWASTDLLAIHQILADGLKVIAEKRPHVVLNYILGDARRLSVGDSHDPIATSCTLIRAMAPHLTPQDVGRLEAAIGSSRRYIESEVADTKQRFWCARDNRLHRLRLVQALEKSAHLSRSARTLIEQETRLLHGMSDRTHVVSEFREIQSPMKVSQMAKARDEDILGLFQDLPDSTGWHHPSRWLQGGSIEASRELAELAKKEPARALRLISHFTPATHSRPVAHVLGAIAEAEPGLPTEAFEDIVAELEFRGFSSNEYRHDVSWALSKVARRGNGLSDRICAMLERWLRNHEEGAPAASERAENGSSGEVRSILAGWGGGGVLPGGNFPVLYALLCGYLRQTPPRVDALVATFKTHLQQRVESERVWRALLSYMHYLPGEAVQNLADGIFARYPAVRDNTEGARMIARVSRLIESSTLRRWLHGMRDSGWRRGPQAYGELLLLVAAFRPELAWATAELDAVLQLNESEDDKTAATLLGIAFAAAELWTSPEARTLSTTVLLNLIPRAKGDIASALMVAVFRYNQPMLADKATTTVLDQILTHPGVLAAGGTHKIVTCLSATCAHDPNRVTALCNAWLDEIEDMQDSWSRLSQAGDELIHIAITLQRMHGHQDAGLDLFERLLKLDLYGIRDVLHEVDVRTGRLAIPRRRAPGKG